MPQDVQQEFMKFLQHQYWDKSWTRRCLSTILSVFHMMLNGASGWFQISSSVFVLSQLNPIFLWNMNLSKCLCAQLVDFSNMDISAMTVYLYTNSKYKVRDLTQVSFQYIMLNINALKLSKGVIWYQKRISEEDNTFLLKIINSVIVTETFIKFSDWKTGKIKFLKQNATPAMILLV